MPLSLDEITDFVMTNSGQYIGGLDFTLLSQDQLTAIFTRELSVYSRYYPLVSTRSFRLYNSKVFQLENDGVIPDIITKIMRSATQSIIFSGAGQLRFGQVPGYVWRYDKPVLYFNEADDFYIVEFTQSHIFNSDNTGIDTLDISKEEYLNLCLGRFMISVGRGRRSLQTQDFPIISDAAQLVSDGQQIYNDAINTLQTGSLFWLSLKT